MVQPPSRANEYHVHFPLVQRRPRQPVTIPKPGKTQGHTLGRWGERTRPFKKSGWQLHRGVCKATAPLSHSIFRPHIERFLECESEAVAFTLSYMQVEKDLLNGLIPASRRHRGERLRQALHCAPSAITNPWDYGGSILVRHDAFPDSDYVRADGSRVRSPHLPDLKLRTALGCPMPVIHVRQRALAQANFTDPWPGNFQDSL